MTRVICAGEPGELEINTCNTLHYNEGGRVRKFYQTLTVIFTPDSSTANPYYWSVFNWGAGEEARSGDFKGQIKSAGFTSPVLASTHSNRQEQAKRMRGYDPASTRHPMPMVGSKLLTELGVTRSAGTLRPGKAVPAFPEPKTPVEVVDGVAYDMLAASIGNAASASLNALMAGDFATAVINRQQLLGLMEQVRTLQEQGEGQLEMVNAKLSASI